MSFNKFLKCTMLFGVFITLFTGCFDPPDEFVSPQWDTEVNIPITSKEFSLMEIVEKDSSLLKASQDPETLGLIYFGDTQNVSTIRIEDELKLDPFETSFSQKIGPLHVNVPLPAGTTIRVEDWTTDVTSGSYQVFPEQEGDVTVDIEGIETVESILIDEGTLLLVIFNNLPVEIVLRGIKIQNATDNSVVAEKSESIPSEWITIPPGIIDTVSFPIYNKNVSNSLQYIGTIWSGGSNNEEVYIREQAGTRIVALFQDLVIGSARAQLPSQNFYFDGEILIDDSTKIEEAVINEGSALLTVNNNLDVDLTAVLSMKNLYDASDNQYTITIPLAKNEKNKIINIPSLKDWRILSAEPGVPSGSIEYTVEATTDSTDYVSTVSKEDSITFNVNFEGLVFDSFTGILKPTLFELEESGFKLDYGDFNEQLQFGEINFKNAVFYLIMKSSFDMDLLLDGSLFAISSNEVNTKDINDILIPSINPIEIKISSLINGFSSELPDSFSLSGSGLLNPYYKTSQIVRGDSVYGAIEFEIPLNVGIAQGNFTDTLDIDLNDEEDIENFNYGEVTITISNSVPVGLDVTAIVLDSNYNQILQLPTSYNDISSLEVPQPEVSETGDILLASQKVQTLILYQEDIQKLLKNPYILIDVNFVTAGNEVNPVKFKTSNKISFDIRAKAEYRVDL